MKKLLIICGPSGSGKSYIETQLIRKYSNIFTKAEQYTTREKRENEESKYIFIDKDHYDIIKDCLFARTCINGDWYGSVPVFKEDKITTVIANAEAIIDTKTYCKENNIDFLIIKIDSEKPIIRSGRNSEFVDKERETLEGLFDKEFINVPPQNMINPDIIFNYLKEYFKL